MQGAMQGSMPGKVKDNRGQIVAIALAIGLHVALAVGVLKAAKGDHGIPKPDEDRFANATIIEASLVKKGKPKDPKKVPMRETIAPVKPEDGPKITTNTSAPIIDPKKAPPPPDPRAKVDPLAAAQARARQMAGEDAVPQGDSKPVTNEGDENGSEWGTSAVASGDPYLAEIKGRIQANWDVPESMISAEELLKLKVVACFKVNAQGDIVDSRIEKASGSKRFDQTFQDAIDKTKNVGEPRGEYKKTIQEEGVCARFQKIVE